MTALVSALYAEGRSDERFLPILLQRVLADLLSRRAPRVVDVVEPFVLRPAKSPSREEAILASAQQSAGYHVLFVHADADDATAESAYLERIEPGLSMVQSAYGDGVLVCHHLVPVIPVQMVEAWLLADAEALCAMVGITLVKAASHLPRAHEVEGLSDPKARLIDIIRLAQAQRPRHRRRIVIGEYYEPLANRVRLEELRRLPSYQKLEADLEEMLRQLGFIQP